MKVVNAFGEERFTKKREHYEIYECPNCHNRVYVGVSMSQPATDPY